ncbi:MAG: GNAT family N-acetyltransferase [Propionibacteriaceae bacterium]|jgi:GNAT superfamily N-acetyltransferase|nr:GNAT family N-acetyltransferase [Propionibacteriaceae bacterium]
MEFSIREINRWDPGDDVDTIAALAREIWTEHYVPITGQAQVDYMLQSFQSAPVITADLTERGHRYWLAEAAGVPIAYCAGVAEAEQLFLSKIYIHRSHRGLGLSRQFLGLLSQWCREAGLSRIELKVNKQNHSTIAAYKKLGFSTVRAAEFDIGNGFIQDDYIMALPIELIEAHG